MSGYETCPKCEVKERLEGKPIDVPSQQIPGGRVGREAAVWVGEGGIWKYKCAICGREWSAGEGVTKEPKP